MAVSSRKPLDPTVAHFRHVRRVENDYRTQLRRIARHVGEIIAAFPNADYDSLPQLQRALQAYAEAVTPWAEATAARMIAQVSQRDATAWQRLARSIGINLRDEVYNTPLGAVARQIVDDQVNLIRSLPLDAAQRVQALTMEGLTGGRRYGEVEKMIRETGHVTASRATLIARTETAKAQSAIVQARSRYVGASTYRWWTVRDIDVRPMHKRLHGTIQDWNNPPVAEEGGQRHHPGEFPNCRCFAEPIITP